MDEIQRYALELSARVNESAGLREQREARGYTRRRPCSRACSSLNECQIRGTAQDRYFEAIPSRSILRLRASTNSMLRRRYSLYVSRS